MVNRTALFIDTETTDKDNPEVIQLAWLSHDRKSKYMNLYKPTNPITFGAMAVHHILPEDVAESKPSAAAPQDVPEVEFWIGHNVDFDWKALGQPPVRRICTLALCRSLFPEAKSHTLSAMAYFLLGATPTTREMLELAHDAGGDVRILVAIYDEIVGVLKTDHLPDVWELSEEARIPKVWTFGKFKDQPISAADRGYANWYRKTPDPDPYVLEALKRARLL